MVCTYSACVHKLHYWWSSWSGKLAFALNPKWDKNLNNYCTITTKLKLAFVGFVANQIIQPSFRFRSLRYSQIKRHLHISVAYFCTQLHICRFLSRFLSNKCKCQTDARLNGWKTNLSTSISWSCFWWFSFILFILSCIHNYNRVEY